MTLNDQKQYTKITDGKSTIFTDELDQVVFWLIEVV